MLSTLFARLRQGYRTRPWPDPDFTPPPDFAGLPEITAKCPEKCCACTAVCPTHALKREEGSCAVTLDLGRCTFCRKCEQQCPNKVIHFTSEYRMAAANEADLCLTYGKTLPPLPKMDAQWRKLFHHSFRIKELAVGDCGGCLNACAALDGIVWDIERFGIQFVDSPRHADALYVTGAVPRNAQQLLLTTFEAMPDPKIIIVCGTCAMSGGLFAEGGQNAKGCAPFMKADLYIPGCPPHPMTELTALLSYLGA